MGKSTAGRPSEAPRSWKDRVDILLSSLVLLGLAAFGPGVIADAFHNGSAWQWGLFVIWLCAVAGMSWSVFATNQRPTPIVPMDVSDEVVRAVVSTTTTRIEAIKALRQNHPGLGLKAAADLVDQPRS